MSYLVNLVNKRPDWTLILVMLAAGAWLQSCSRQVTVSVEPAISLAPSSLDLLADDRIEDKHPAFDPTMVDSRLFPGWDINASAAVIHLDILAGSELPVEMGRLHANYAAAAQDLNKVSRFAILPSINSLDGKAKQFDDGLMAAIVSLGAPQNNGREQAAPKILGRLLEKLPNNSDAHAWAFSALQIGGYLDEDRMSLAPARSAALVTKFLESAEAKPLAFYDWTPDLVRLWRFHRFLRQQLGQAPARQLRKALAADRQLSRDYRALIEFHARLSNPPAKNRPHLLAGDGSFFLPAMGSREGELFDKLFGGAAIPPQVDLMQEFVKAIRSGAVDLKPRPGSGWYDHQVYALETFLLAERGAENQKLLLTKAYKQRMLEAFKALLTKRRETHAVEAPKAAAAPPPAPRVYPELRVEPNPTFYLRTARSYAFIEQVLATLLSEDERRGLTGLREDGPRELPLAQELAAIKTLFYGLHLVACKDIGMKPEITAEELPDPAPAAAAAEKYLRSWHTDADLKADTRVCAPVATGRSWCTLGIKAIELRASYAMPPRGRPTGSQAEWTEMLTGSSGYLLLADEFAEIRTLLPPSRKELREVADREKTRDGIVAALAK